MPAVKRQAAASVPGRPRLGLGFFRDTYSELRKVIWPTRREALYLTTMVILVSLALGAMLGAIDYLFSKLVGRVLLP